ncbi:MAG TPA: hypothetical protein VLD67_03525, partial [Vicinamibacterales bacterium]|nr:hypothetical protein [Vicinamibacterales bacterium]
MRSSSFAAFLLALLTGSEGLWLDAAQAPQRDAMRAVQVGSALIAGTVVTDEEDSRPVRRSRVTLNNAERTVGRT